MKVFLSWSGNKSEKIAMVFRDWLPEVIQEIEPFLSSEDIETGSRWSTDIAKELADTSFGILCVTRQNIAAPWLNFEAGALSKTIDSARVCPFLFDISGLEVKGPLLQFQSATPKKDDLKKLVSSINKACEKNPLSEERFNETFDIWYPNLDEKLTELKNAKDEADGEEDNGAPDTKENPEILEEILELTRTNQKLIRALEKDSATVKALNELNPMIRTLMVRSLQKDSALGFGNLGLLNKGLFGQGNLPGDGKTLLERVQEIDSSTEKK